MYDLSLQNFFAAFAHRREIFPEFFEQLFLEIAVAGAAFFKSLAHVRDFIFRREQRVELKIVDLAGIFRRFDRC